MMRRFLQDHSTPKGRLLHVKSLQQLFSNHFNSSIELGLLRTGHLTKVGTSDHHPSTGVIDTGHSAIAGLNHQ